MAVLKDNEGNVLASVDEKATPVAPEVPVTPPATRRTAYECLINVFDGVEKTRVGEKILVAAKDV
jgi:hypothetical protein